MTSENTKPEEKTKIGTFVKGKTIGETWPKLIKAIWKKGHTLHSEYNNDTKEILQLLAYIENPLEEPMIPKGFPWTKERLDQYTTQTILSGDPGEFIYTYGNRLHKWNNELNQIDWAIKKLKASPNTRRVICHTWIPTTDTESPEPPCLIFTHFQVRDNKVHLHVYFRSHDCFGAWPANMYGLAQLMKKVADGSGFETGSITCVSGSAHIYDHNWENVKEVLNIE
ncbi:MAG: thymidylate synthase [Candidatus Diapherotrites archaeon]|nr:thymidylate synthase [Candidatus Diapherotrites archaeon]